MGNKQIKIIDYSLFKKYDFMNIDYEVINQLNDIYDAINNQLKYKKNNSNMYDKKILLQLKNSYDETRINYFYHTIKLMDKCINKLIHYIDKYKINYIKHHRLLLNNNNKCNYKCIKKISMLQCKNSFYEHRDINLLINNDKLNQYIDNLFDDIHIDFILNKFWDDGLIFNIIINKCMICNNNNIELKELCKSKLI